MWQKQTSGVVCPHSLSPISLDILSLSLSPFLLTSLLVCPASSTSSSLCDGALATASPSPPARPARRSVIELNIDMARADRASTLRWCVPTAAASTLGRGPSDSAKMLETNSVQSCKFVPGFKLPSLLPLKRLGRLGWSGWRMSLWEPLAMASRRAKVEVLQPSPRTNGEGGPPRPRAAWDAGEL